jgi:hypothetical protein
MDFLDDPEEMTPEDRLAEVVAILAAGYLRLRQSPSMPATDLESPPSTAKPLDCPGEPLPLCDEGLTDGEPAPTEVSG